MGGALKKTRRAPGRPALVGNRGFAKIVGERGEMPFDQAVKLVRSGLPG